MVDTLHLRPKFTQYPHCDHGQSSSESFFFALNSTDLRVLSRGLCRSRGSSPVTRAVGLLSGMGVRNPPVLCNLIAPAQPGSHLLVAHPHGHHAPDLLPKVSHALCTCTLLPVPQVLPAFSVTADQLCPQETSEGCHLAGARVTSPGILASQPWGWVFCRVCPLWVLSFYPTVNSSISLYLTVTFWSCFNN